MTTYKRRRARSLAVAGAVVAALGVWVVAELALGLQLRSPAFARSGDSFEIGPATIALTALLLSLAGWALMAVLERFTVRAARIWLVIAVLALVASLSGPLSGTGLGAAQRAALIGMHLAVGAVLIPSLYTTSRARRERKEGQRGALHAA